MNITFHTPGDIEGESMRIIQQELDEMGVTLEADCGDVVRRAIHTTADFDYAKNLVFTPGAAAAGVAALRAGTPIVTDTNMARSGINQKACAQFRVERLCYMADPEVAQSAKANGTTRAVAAVDRWAQEYPNAIFAVGNAPTALLRMCELMEASKLRPALVIAVPVGFVNVVESKEAMLALCRKQNVPAIVAMGRKGGSTVAAAICNALLYRTFER